MPVMPEGPNGAPVHMFKLTATQEITPEQWGAGGAALTERPIWAAGLRGTNLAESLIAQFRGRNPPAQTQHTADAMSTRQQRPPTCVL